MMGRERGTDEDRVGRGGEEVPVDHRYVGRHRAWLVVDFELELRAADPISRALWSRNVWGELRPDDLSQGARFCIAVFRRMHELGKKC